MGRLWSCVAPWNSPSTGVNCKLMQDLTRRLHRLHLLTNRCVVVLEHDLAGSRDICTGFHLLTSTLSGIFLLRHELVCNVALSIPPFTTQSEPVAGQTHECERRRGYRVIPHVKRGEVAVLLTSGDTLVRHRLVCVKCGVRLCQRIAVPRPSHWLRHCINAAQRPGQKAKKEGNQRIEYVYSK